MMVCMLRLVNLIMIFWLQLGKYFDSCSPVSSVVSGCMIIWTEPGWGQECQIMILAEAPLLTHGTPEYHIKWVNYHLSKHTGLNLSGWEHFWRIKINNGLRRHLNLSNTCTLDTWLDMCGLNTINLHRWQKTCEIFSHLWATCLQTNYLLTEKGNNVIDYQAFKANAIE